MEFAINSASVEVYFVLRSSCKMNLLEFQRKNAVFGGTEYSLVGYPLRAISGHKMSEMVNVKVIQTDIFETSLCVIDNGMSNNNKANQ